MFRSTLTNFLHKKKQLLQKLEPTKQNRKQLHPQLFALGFSNLVRLTFLFVFEHFRLNIKQRKQVRIKRFSPFFLCRIILARRVPPLEFNFTNRLFRFLFFFPPLPFRFPSISFQLRKRSGFGRARRRTDRHHRGGGIEGRRRPDGGGQDGATRQAQGR